MCQPGMVVGAGAGTADGYLDIDFSKVDYTTTYTTEEEIEEEEIEEDNNFEIKEFNRIHSSIPITISSIAGLGATAFGIRFVNKYRHKKKRKNKTKRK